MSEKPQLDIEMNRDLPEGEYVAFGADPAHHQRLRCPQDPIPSWARTVHLSIEDYGKLMLARHGSAA